LALYLLIHHRVTLVRQPQVTLAKKLLDSFGIGRDAKARGLRDLERAGLIEVERAKGRTALVSLRNAASIGG